MLNTWCFSCLSCKILFELKIENFTQKSFVKHCLFLHLLTIFLHYTLPYTRTVSSQLVYLSLYTACRKVITTGYHNMLYTVTVWFHINSTERYTVVKYSSSHTWFSFLHEGDLSLFMPPFRSRKSIFVIIFWVRM